MQNYAASKELNLKTPFVYLLMCLQRFLAKSSVDPDQTAPSLTQRRVSLNF